MCVVDFFHLGLLLIVFFLHILVIYSGVFSVSLGDPHSPTYTHPPHLQGFCSDAHRFTLKCWLVVGGVGWTTFRDSPYENDFILMTQVRVIIIMLAFDCS